MCAEHTLKQPIKVRWISEVLADMALRLLLVATLAAYVYVVYLVTPLQPRLSAPTPFILDMVPFGIFDDAYADGLMDMLGAPGRAEYARLYTSGADIAFPLVVILTLLEARRTCFEEARRPPLIAAVVTGAADLCANACHMSTLTMYPDRPHYLVRRLAPIAEFVKWTSSLLVVPYFAVAIYRYFRRHRHQA